MGRVSRWVAVSSVVAILLVLGIGTAWYLGAFSPHPRLALDTFNEVYDTAGTRLDTCATCHTSGRQLNSYGEAGRAEFLAMRDLSMEGLSEAEEVEAFKAALREVEAEDSDGDGSSNREEIAARMFPGDPEDQPTR